VLETINLDRGCFACTLGGADGRTLFLMAAEWHGLAKMADGGTNGPGTHRRSVRSRRWVAVKKEILALLSKSPGFARHCSGGSWCPPKPFRRFQMKYILMDYVNESGWPILTDAEKDHWLGSLHCIR